MRLLIYLTRWQFSGIVMMIPFKLLTLLGFINPYLNIAVASLVGGLIFYKLDKKIFSGA